MENTVVNLELTVGEVNVILRSLGKHPFDEIATLITKIKGQGEKQLEAAVAKQQAEQAAAGTKAA